MGAGLEPARAVHDVSPRRQDRHHYGCGVRATELAEETWHAIVDLVLNGTFYCCKYVGQQMLRQKSGSIFLTATTDALIGQASVDGYTAAKGGVAMTRSLAAGVSPEACG
jgi:NAD(P)-dependent dehydrogenase (short-subunit alcohol dehydrogenase family)